MIKIDFTEPDSPEWSGWRAECEAEQLRHNAAIERGERQTADSKIYGRLKRTVYIDPEGPFHGKCAYCEERIRTNQHGDVEHFRPKGGIRQEHDDKPVLRRGTSDPHPGYYWLAYDWRNLLPSCVLCNRPSTEPGERSIGKRNYFPLADEGKRAQGPGEESAEVPLLIHPVLEEPSDHLGLDASGVFFAKDGSPRGEACIRIFGLNLRGLPDVRARVYNDTKLLYKNYFNTRLVAPQSPEADRAHARIQAKEAGGDEFTAAARLAIADAKREILAIIDES
jgi:hypothetical protein